MQAYIASSHSTRWNLIENEQIKNESEHDLRVDRFATVQCDVTPLDRYLDPIGMLTSRIQGTATNFDVVVTYVVLKPEEKLY